jgi:hypothetical protein
MPPGINHAAWDTAAHLERRARLRAKRHPHNVSCERAGCIDDGSGGELNAVFGAHRVDVALATRTRSPYSQGGRLSIVHSHAHCLAFCAERRNERPRIEPTLVLHA